MHIVLLKFEEKKMQLKRVLIAYAGVNETQAFNLEIMMQYVIILFISYPRKLQQLRPRAEPEHQHQNRKEKPKEKKLLINPLIKDIEEN